MNIMVSLQSFKTLALCLLLLTLSVTAFSGEVTTQAIRIGATVSLSGKYRGPSGMIHNAYKLWAKQVNSRGGVLNRPVKLIIYDDQSREEQVKTLYKKLVTEEKVDLILSPYSTTLTFAASEVTEQAGLVMLASGASGRQIWERGYQYVFGVYALADRYFVGFLDLIARNGFGTVMLLYEKSGFPVSAAEGVRYWTDQFGLNIIYEEDFDSDRIFPRLLKKARVANADALIFCAYPPEVYKFIDMMNRAMFRPKAVTFTIAPVYSEFYAHAGTMAEGVFGPSQWEADERLPFPGTLKFIKDFKTFSGKVPTYHAASAYSACQILERAIAYTRSLDHNKIRDFIRALDTVTVMGRFKVDETGRQIGHNPIIIQWQKGKKEIVYPTKMSTALPRFDY